VPSRERGTSAGKTVPSLDESTCFRGKGKGKDNDDSIRGARRQSKAQRQRVSTTHSPDEKSSARNAQLYNPPPSRRKREGPADRTGEEPAAGPAARGPAGPPGEARTAPRSRSQLPRNPAPVAEATTRLRPHYLRLIVISGVRHGYGAREHRGRERKELSTPASRDRKFGPAGACRETGSPPAPRADCSDSRGRYYKPPKVFFLPRIEACERMWVTLSSFAKGWTK
jgi:hypothetical protein